MDYFQIVIVAMDMCCRKNVCASDVFIAVKLSTIVAGITACLDRSVVS